MNIYLQGRTLSETHNGLALVRPTDIGWYTGIVQDVIQYSTLIKLDGMRVWYTFDASSQQWVSMKIGYSIRPTDFTPLDDGMYRRLFLPPPTIPTRLIRVDLDNSYHILTAVCPCANLTTYEARTITTSGLRMYCIPEEFTFIEDMSEVPHETLQRIMEMLLS